MKETRLNKGEWRNPCSPRLKDQEVCRLEDCSYEELVTFLIQLEATAMKVRRLLNIDENGEAIQIRE